MKRISIIVPCYNEEESIPLFYQACREAFTNLPAEPEWFVDDGTRRDAFVPQKAWREDPRAHYISFSRNFGKESAMYAGLEAATGDYIAVMDADLQDPPLPLGQMLEGLESGAR